VFARSFDRRHSIELVKAGVENPVRETFESALTLGMTLLRAFGADEERIAATIAEVRLRDADRFALQLAGDIYAGRDLMLGNAGMAVENSG
jgi:voltage-gated potassium channel Kch